MATNLVVGATIGRPHAERIALQTGGETPPLRRLDFAGSGGIWNAPYGKKGSLAFSCGRRGTAERWMRSRRAQSYSFHSVIRFHTRFFFERAPGKPKPFGFSRSEKLRHRGGFGLPGAPAQKKMDKGQYPLSAKRKCHTNIPAANILTLLPAAGARKRGLFIKSPLLTPSKIFTRHTPNFQRTHPKRRVSLRKPRRRRCAQLTLQAAPQVPAGGAGGKSIKTRRQFPAGGLFCDQLRPREC